MDWIEVAGAALLNATGLEGLKDGTLARSDGIGCNTYSQHPFALARFSLDISPKIFYTGTVTCRQ